MCVYRVSLLLIIKTDSKCSIREGQKTEQRMSLVGGARAGHVKSKVQLVCHIEVLLMDSDTNFANVAF